MVPETLQLGINGRGETCFWFQPFFLHPSFSSTPHLHILTHRLEQQMCVCRPTHAQIPIPPFPSEPLLHHPVSTSGSHLEATSFLLFLLLSTPRSLSFSLTQPVCVCVCVKSLHQHMCKHRLRHLCPLSPPQQPQACVSCNTIANTQTGTNA